MGINQIFHTDLQGLFTLFNNAITSLVSRMGRCAWIFLLAAIATALLIGLSGVMLSKAFSGIAMGGLGYLFGVALGRWIFSVERFLFAPIFPIYVCGAIFACLFFLLGWKRCKLSICLLLAFAGFWLTWTYAPFDNVYLFLGAALLCGVLAGFVTKPVFCALTATAGGFLLVSLLGRVFSNAAFLQFSEGRQALSIAIALSVVFFTVQLILSRKYRLEK